VPSDFLDKILEYKKGLVQEKKAFYKALKKKFDKERLTRYQFFKKVISVPGKINLIAEVKKASPSKGLLYRDFDPVALAKIYAANGAAALSVLSEDKFFYGSPSDIKKVSEKVNLPILMKDFIIDEGQIYEAFVVGASAVLLITAILKEDKLKKLMETASGLALDCLVEVHDEPELDTARRVGAEIIGINNRNLKTFEVDLGVSERLIKKIPKDKVIVVESGIKSFKEVQNFKRLGANAVLIGETFLRAPDVGAKMSELMGYEKKKI